MSDKEPNHNDGKQMIGLFFYSLIFLFLEEFLRVKGYVEYEIYFFSLVITLITLKNYKDKGDLIGLMIGLIMAGLLLLVVLLTKIRYDH